MLFSKFLEITYRIFEYQQRKLLIRWKVFLCYPTFVIDHWKRICVEASRKGCGHLCAPSFRSVWHLYAWWLLDRWRLMVRSCRSMWKDSKWTPMENGYRSVVTVNGKYIRNRLIGNLAFGNQKIIPWETFLSPSQIRYCSRLLPSCKSDLDIDRQINENHI